MKEKNEENTSGGTPGFCCIAKAEAVGRDTSQRARERQSDRDRQRQRQTDRQTDRDRDRETDRETERQRDRETHMHTHMQTHAHRSAQTHTFGVLLARYCCHTACSAALRDACKRPTALALASSPAPPPLPRVWGDASAADTAPCPSCMG